MAHDPITLAYIAGAIDADGHITVTRSLRKKGKRYTHAPTYYHPRIGYTSTSQIVPKLIQMTFGGAVHQYQPKNPAHRRVYIWSVSTHACGVVAAALIPHLRQKKRQAEHLVALCTLISTQHEIQKQTQKPPYRITAEQLAAREVLWLAVTELNEPRNRRVHGAGKKLSGRLLDGKLHDEFPNQEAR